MKKILLYLGYAVYVQGALAILYAVGKMSVELFMSDKSLGHILGLTFGGSLMLLLLIIVGGLTWTLLEGIFGDPNSATYKKAEQIANDITP